MVKSIIINFPTNIGDTILGLPVLDCARANYPDGKITAIASYHTREFLLRNNFIDEVVVFDKLWKMKQKWKFCLSLREKYDIIIDLKNSFLPVLLGIRKRTPFLRRYPKNMHIAEKYLAFTKNLLEDKKGLRSSFVLTDKEKEKWARQKIPPSIFIACSSRSPLKRYSYECLKEVVQGLNLISPLVILGDKTDSEYYKDILKEENIINLAGKTSMSEVFYLLSNYARCVLCVDSSILHAGSYLNKPTVALFGPTHPDRSGPRSKNSIVLWKRNLSCVSCEMPVCENDFECMKIVPSRVVSAVEKVLGKAA